MDKMQKRNISPEVELVVLFDGVCSLCNKFIQFYEKAKKGTTIKYIPFQSKEAQLYVSSSALAKQNESVIVLYKGSAYKRAEAIRVLIKHLKPSWSWLKLISLFPDFILNTGYDLVAKYRYLVFGKTDQCIIKYDE